jgi:hypothetical protein
MHAVEFHRRELLAMRLILDKTPPDAHAGAEFPPDLFVAIVAAASDAHHVVPEHLQRMPWFAIVVRFLTKRLGDADHRLLLCNNALLAALPAGVRARTFGQLIDNLALRIRPPLAFEPSVGRADQLLNPIRTAMTTDDNDSLMKIADEFVALAVRAYDLVANELRWLVMPRVVQRRFQCRQQTIAWSNCACAPRLPSLKAALMCACAPDEVSAHHTALLTRARLFVQLFGCVEHYLRVGGASFVRRAVEELLDGAAEIDDDRDESLLHLYADALRASVAVVRGADREVVLFHPTTTVAGADERVVVFRQHPIDGTWCVGEALRCIGDDVDVLKLSVSRECRMRLFNALRAGHAELSDTPPPVTLDGLRRLVGERNKWLNSDAIYGLLVLATRGIDGVRVYDPFLLEQARHAIGSARRLVVPWNEREGHWSLMCLDLVALTAVYFDSLDGAVSQKMREFCASVFGKRWRGGIKKLHSPQQTDGYNCGVFVVLNAFRWVRGEELPERYEVTQRVRVEWARAWLLGVASLLWHVIGTKSYELDD